MKATQVVFGKPVFDGFVGSNTNFEATSLTLIEMFDTKITPEKPTSDRYVKLKAEDGSMYILKASAISFLHKEKKNILVKDGNIPADLDEIETEECSINPDVRFSCSKGNLTAA